MQKQYLPLGAAWLASLAAVYFIASGETAKAPIHAAAAAASAPAVQPGSGPRDRTVRRAIDELKEKAGVPQIVGRLRLETRNVSVGMLDMRGVQALAALADLDEAELQEALSLVDRTVESPQQRMIIFSLLLSRWAETDGSAALAYTDEKFAQRKPFEREIRNVVLASWASREPEAAWTWFLADQKKVRDGLTGDITLEPLFSGLARNDLDATLHRLPALDERSGLIALGGVLNAVNTQEACNRMAKEIGLLPPKQRAYATQRLASQWASIDTAAAIQWMRTLPPEEEKNARISISGALLMTKSEAGADLRMESVEEKDKPAAYEHLMMVWADQDPRGAGEWLKKQPQGPELDGAREEYAQNVSAKDPLGAMEWAKSIQDDRRRTSAVEFVYQQWRKKDAASADAALNAAGLPGERVKQLRGLPANMGPSIERGGITNSINDDE